MIPENIYISPTIDWADGVMSTWDAMCIALFNENDDEIIMIGRTDCQSDTCVTVGSIKEALKEVVGVRSEKRS